jgi:hypothetical protein
MKPSRYEDTEEEAEIPQDGERVDENVWVPQGAKEMPRPLNLLGHLEHQLPYRWLKRQEWEARVFLIQRGNEVVHKNAIH